MARNLNIPHKTPNDLLTADEFNTLVVATEQSVTSKLDLSLDQVDNTRDINKPISIPTQAALNNKQNNLGFTPENPNNKVVDLLTPNHTTYPTTLAVSNAIFNSGVVVTDATPTVKGKIALTGDLGGTADAPIVPGLANKQDILPTGTTTQYLRGDKTLATLSTDVVTEGTTNKYLSSTERNKLNGIAAGATVNDSDVNLKNRLNHTGTQSADTITDGTTNKLYSATEKTKLAGIAAGATVNSSDAVLLARANHTGTESADNIIDGTINKVYTATEKTKLAGVATGATVNDSDLNLKNRANHTGTQTADTLIDGTTNKVFTAANQTKLNGIATAATANSTDATLRDRSTHTGTQAQSTITNLGTSLAAKADLVGGLVPLSQMPNVDIYPNFNNKFFKDEGGNIIGINPFELFARELMEGQMHGWTPQFGAATVIGIGVPSANMSVTVTPRSYDATSYLSSERRVQVLGAATAGTRIGQRDATPRFSTKWGFRGKFRYCVTDAAAIAGARNFAGFTTDTGTLANAEPSSLLNIIGVGNDSADNTLQVIYNDGTGAATKIDLGLNFPSNTINTDIYDVTIIVAAGGATASVMVTRINGSDGSIFATTTKQITGGLPDLTVALCSQVWRTNNATALAPSIDVMASMFHTKYI